MNGLNRTRTLLGLWIPLAWIAIAVVPFALTWSRLPEPMACHWSFRGLPDGALPRVSVLALYGGVAALAAIGAWLATRGAVARTSIGTATFLGVLFAAISAVTVLANLDAPTWRAARGGPVVIAVGLVVASGVVARLVSRAARALERPARGAVVPRATVGLGATERAMWTAGAHNRWLAWVAFALVAVAVALPLVPAGVMVLTALLLIEFTSAQVRVDDRGVRVAFGPFHFPRIRVRLADIREARAVDIVPMANGGWGYRGSLTIAGKAAVVIRGGEGLELRLDGDRILRVTVDDAATAAGLVNDLVARAR